MERLTKGITPYFILAVIVAVFYGNTLVNGFVHDDVWQVENKAQIRSLDIGRIFGGCIAEELLGGCEGRGFYWRPMQALGNALVYQISQSPKFFHFVNLVYFWAGGVLVYVVTREILARDPVNVAGPAGRFPRPTSSLQSNVEIKNNKFLDAAGARRGSPAPVTRNILIAATPRETSATKNWLAILAAVIFVSHPVNSEAVNWISATPELLMAVFFLLSFLCYLKYLKLLRFLKLLIFSAGFFFLALLAKETAVFLAALFPLTLMLINANGKRMYANVRMLLVYLIPLVIYLLARSAILGRVVYKYEGYYSLSFFEQGLTALALLPQYLLKFVYPLPLSFQPQVVPITSFGTEVIWGIGVIGGLFTLAYVLSVRKMWLALFGLFWILISILPALIFVNKLGETIFAERYLFFATVGFGLVVAGVVCELYARFASRLRRTSLSAGEARRANFKRIDANRQRSRIILGILIVGFMCWLVWAWWAVHNRSADWKDNKASYKAMIKVDPSHKKAQFQLGEIYRSGGDIVAARAQYELALSIDPNYQEAQAALARVSKQYVGEQLSFYYPEDWELVEKKDEIILYDLDKKFEVQIKVNKIDVSPAEYLKSQKETFGKLVNEGQALIPGFDEAWVKVWQIQEGQRDKGTKFIEDIKLQFFLFAKGKVVKVLVSDANSPQMKVFEGVLASIKLM